MTNCGLWPRIGTHDGGPQKKPRLDRDCSTTDDGDDDYRCILETIEVTHLEDMGK